MTANALAAAANLIASPLALPLNPPLRILVVDDDEGIRRLNSKVLARAGYVVDDAGDGAAAWEALNRKSYDLLITDNRMPKVTGVELLKLVRGARLGLPVIMASGTLPIDEFDRQPWIKPTAMLCKPYLLEALVQTVDQVLGGTRPTRMG